MCREAGFELRFDCCRISAVFHRGCGPPQCFPRWLVTCSMTARSGVLRIFLLSQVSNKCVSWSYQRASGDKGLSQETQPQFRIACKRFCRRMEDDIGHATQIPSASNTRFVFISTRCLMDRTSKVGDNLVPASIGFDEAEEEGRSWVLVCRSLVSDRSSLLTPAWVLLGGLVLAAALIRVRDGGGSSSGSKKAKKTELRLLFRSSSVFRVVQGAACGPWRHHEVSGVRGVSPVSPCCSQAWSPSIPIQYSTPFATYDS